MHGRAGQVLYLDHRLHLVARFDGRRDLQAEDQPAAGNRGNVAAAVLRVGSGRAEIGAVIAAVGATAGLASGPAFQANPFLGRGRRTTVKEPFRCVSPAEQVNGLARGVSQCQPSLGLKERDIVLGVADQADRLPGPSQQIVPIARQVGRLFPGMDQLFGLAAAELVPQ